jgi:hypothetical protein
VKVYGTGVAVPVKPGSGTNDTVPLAFAVYVPSPDTVTLVREHGADSPGVHSFTGDPLDGLDAPVDTASLTIGAIVCVTP